MELQVKQNKKKPVKKPHEEVAESDRQVILVPDQPATSTSKPFIEANTIEGDLKHVKEEHIIPVFIKDNEPVISHSDFIEATQEIITSIYPSETILSPSIRLSHPVKGRIPEARNKPANELLEHEKTLYYERMAFIIEIPSISDEISGSHLSLTVGGVKALNLDNLYSTKGTDEHFKVFIGFKNRVCTNLCVFTDGFMGDLKVKNIGQLKACIKTLFDGFNTGLYLNSMRNSTDYSLTEDQFAYLIGRCRMFSHLPYHLKKDIPEILITDTQVSLMVKDFYKDQSFSRDVNGNINLWNLYNLFTSANKSSYIDNFLDRSAGAFRFIERLKRAIQNREDNWYLI